MAEVLFDHPRQRSLDMAYIGLLRLPAAEFV
jgi:hypothetical protein